MSALDVQRPPMTVERLNSRLESIIDYATEVDQRLEVLWPDSQFTSYEAGVATLAVPPNLLPSVSGWAEDSLQVFAESYFNQPLRIRIVGSDYPYPLIARRVTLPDEEQQPARRVLPSPVSDLDALLALNAARLVKGSAVLDAPQMVESIWGIGSECLWSQGEPFLVCGPDGVGKTTLSQQLALAIAGIIDPFVLGFPVTAKEKRVLYLACDRPTQAWRSMRRMVSEADRQLLDEQMVFWRGALPFDIAEQPNGLLTLTKNAGCDVVIIDSLKDVAADLSKEETGVGIKKAFQAVCDAGLDVAALHHQRKQVNGGGKPKALADVYGSRWITAGSGSVVVLWGDPGDLVVEFKHLKHPDEEVGPFNVIHDHSAGRSTVAEKVNAYTVVAQSPKGATVAMVAQAIYGSTDKNATEKARRQLTRLFREEKIHRSGGDRGGSNGSDAALYFPLTSAH